jgi:hypothetical protein
MALYGHPDAMANLIRRTLIADSDEAARVNRDDVARDSEMMSPGIPG